MPVSTAYFASVILLLSAMVSLLTISCISLLNTLLLLFLSLVLFTNEAYYRVSDAKHSNHTNTIIRYLYFDYPSLSRNIINLYRACSIRLLTNDAVIVAVQQNVHVILKILFDEYHLGKHFLKYAQANRNERLKIQGRFDTSTIDIFDEDFIGYDGGRNCLAMTNVVLIDQNNI